MWTYQEDKAKKEIERREKLQSLKTRNAELERENNLLKERLSQYEHYLSEILIK